MLWQLGAGGAVSLLNFLIHAIVTALIMVGTRRTAAATDERHFVIRVVALLLVTVTALFFAHIFEILIWTALYVSVGIGSEQGVSTFESAFENYTALGYGDFVPPSDLRLFGPLAALNGLLLIGWSVFVIFEVMRMAEIRFERTVPRAGDANTE
jgi:hypothetical protein